MLVLSGQPHLQPHLPQMQVLLAQVQNSEQVLRTLQDTVSQAQERVQLQMVRPSGLGKIRGWIELDEEYLEDSPGAGRVHHVLWPVQGAVSHSLLLCTPRPLAPSQNFVVLTLRF